MKTMKPASTVKTLFAALLSMLILTTPALVHAEQPKTITQGTLTIGSDLVYPPYDYLQDGEARGFDADLMALLAPKLGLKVKFEDTRFASLIAGLRASRFDMIASALYVTAERAKVVDYLPYAKTGASLMVRSDDTFAPKTLQDLCGKRVGALKGAAAVTELQRISAADCPASPLVVREFNTSAEAAQALLARGVDVSFDDAGVTKAAVDATGGRLRISSTEILFPVVMGLAVAKGNSQLLSAVTAAFNEVKVSGELATLLTKYNLQQPSDEEIKVAFAPKAN